LLLIIICRLFLDGLAGIKFLLEGKPNHMLSILRAHRSYYKNLFLVLKFRYNNKTRKIYNSEFSIVLKYYVFRVKSFVNLIKH